MGAKDWLRAAAVAGLLLTGFPSAFAQNWTLTSAPITNWSSIAMSADGRKLVATIDRGPIYCSTNFGATWFPIPFTEQSWAAIASSADGNKLAAAAIHFGYIGGIWTSPNSGLDWSMTWALTNTWRGIDCSADGSIVVAVDFGNYEYPRLIATSTNGGWGIWEYYFSINAPERFTSVATSADGRKSMATSTQRIFSSGDSGRTWIAVGAPDSIYTGVACSSDGCRWVAVASGGEIQVSPDFGANWTLESNPSLSWQAVASSRDGSRLVAIATNGPIHISTNSGISWFATPSPSLQWQAVASSADGHKLAAAVYGGGIYTWQSTPSPKLDITPTAGGLLISWIVPSLPFVLKETADLNAPDWTAVPMTPILNLTNLHHEVTVPWSGTNRFYRLQNL